MCGVVDGGIVAGQLGLRGRPERRRRHLRLVHRAPPSPRRTSTPRPPPASPCTSTSPGSPPSRRSASTAWSPSTGTAATARCSSTTSSAALVVGLTLATRPEDVYRALLEATAFGTRVIVETFRDSGVPVEEFIVAGGLAKNALLMQIYADVTRLPLSVIDSEQGPALGSAIHAAVAAGAYPDVPTAAKTHGQGAPRRLPARRGTGRRPTTSCYERVPRAARPLRSRTPRRCAGSRRSAASRGRAPAQEGSASMTVVADVAGDDRRAAPRGLRPARAS